MKVFAVVFALFLAILSGTSNAAKSGNESASLLGLNLLLNAGFEEWETRTDSYQTLFNGLPQFLQTDTVLMPKNWFAELVFSCCVFPELGNAVSQGEPNTGSFGLQLGGFSGFPLQTGIYFYQDVPVTPGVSYVASFHVKNPTGPGARRMRGTWLDTNHRSIGGAFFLAAPFSPEFVRVQGSPTLAPCGAGEIRVYFDKADFGGVTYDDGYFGRDFSVPPTPCPVKIDVKPGSDPNAINLKNQGVIPAAVFSDNNFNAARSLDPATVRLESAAAIRFSAEDVDGDGLEDLMLFFKTQDAGLTCGQTSVQLTGQLFDGSKITGKDSIVTKGC